MSVFTPARASLNHLIWEGKIKKRLSPTLLTTKKVHEAGAQGILHPNLPCKTCRVPGPPRSAGRSRPAAQVAGYLMLPLGRGLGFHLRHKHAGHLPLHRAQAAHGATPSLLDAGSRPEEALQQAAREQYPVQPG